MNKEKKKKEKEFDDYDWDKIHIEGYVSNKHAERLGYDYGTEYALCIIEDQQFDFEDPKVTPKLLKKGVINGIRDEFNTFIDYCMKNPHEIIQTTENNKKNHLIMEDNSNKDNMNLLRTYLILKYLFNMEN